MLASESHEVDIEAQTDRGSRSSRRPRPTVPTPHEINITNGRSHDSTTGVTHNAPHISVSLPHDTSSEDALPAQSEWKPWKADEPLLTKIPESKNMKKIWLKAMEKSDDGMCNGWRDQIDTLIIFAGLFSATVTAFTVESYQWLDETPANTLARLQLRDLLSATHDPAVDHLAPTMFRVSSSSIIINTLWFASLTISLATVVVSILCKQWLHEYQRYDNFTTDESFLIRGLRYRGLKAWRVPEIISFLPILLQTALVLFLVGILILLWPLQTIVASFTATIVGLTFIFLVITTMLPSIQYLFPTFKTQCAYKSSQSWSFFVISAFWLFNFSEFTHWGSIDQWEVTNVYDGMGRTLFRVYQLFRNNFDTLLSLYGILADKSLQPTLNADLVVLPDFVDEFNASSSRNGNDMKCALGLSNDTDNWRLLERLGRISQLATASYKTSRFFTNRQKIRLEAHFPNPLSPGSPGLVWGSRQQSNYQGIQLALHHFLEHSGHADDQRLFNRSIEHWARSLDIKDNLLINSEVNIPHYIYSSKIPYDLEITKWLIGFHTHILQEGQFPSSLASPFIFHFYPKLVESYSQHAMSPSPAILLKGIQEWVVRTPESTLTTKIKRASSVLLGFVVSDIALDTFANCHTSRLDKQYLVSFMRFFMDLYKGEEFQRALQDHDSPWVRFVLEYFRQYLDEDEVTHSESHPNRTRQIDRTSADPKIQPESKQLVS